MRRTKSSASRRFFHALRPMVIGLEDRTVLSMAVTHSFSVSPVVISPPFTVVPTLPIVITPPVVTGAKVIMVTSPNNSGPGTLRQAALMATPGTIITFMPRLPQINVTGMAISIPAGVKILSNGSVRVTGRDVFIFNGTATQPVIVQGLQIRGAILNKGALTLQVCQITGNVSSSQNGVTFSVDQSTVLGSINASLSNDAKLIVTNSSITNTAGTALSVKTSGVKLSTVTVVGTKLQSHNGLAANCAGALNFNLSGVDTAGASLFANVTGNAVLGGRLTTSGGNFTIKAGGTITVAGACSLTTYGGDVDLEAGGDIDLGNITINTVGNDPFDGGNVTIISGGGSGGSGSGGSGDIGSGGGGGVIVVISAPISGGSSGTLHDLHS